MFTLPTEAFTFYCIARQGKKANYMVHEIPETRTTSYMRMMYYSVSDTGILEKISECSYQESNLTPSDY